MKDPVIISTGSTYERASIEAWFAKGKNTDPLTNVVLKNKELVPNYALKSAI